MGLFMPKPSKRPPMPEIMTFKPPKKYIATVVKDDFYVDDFDTEVNEYIDDGYILMKREHYFVDNGKNGKMIFYAELEKIVFDYKQLQAVDG